MDTEEDNFYRYIFLYGMIYGEYAKMVLYLNI